MSRKPKRDKHSFRSAKKKFDKSNNLKPNLVECDMCGAWNSANITMGNSAPNLCDDCLEGIHFSV